MTREPYLINIGNNVTVSTNVTFVTHDNSIKLLYPEKSDVFGKIVIGNNCFVGENVTILYGVTLADNIIVAAGSVVTKSFSNSNIIIGGNPAHIINTCYYCFCGGILHGVFFSKRFNRKKQKK